MKKTKKSKRSFEQVSAPIVLAALLLTGAVAMGDSLFADTHIALYGPLPSSSSNYEYTPIQKADVNSKTTAAQRRAAARKSASSSLRPAAPASSSSTSSSSSSSSAAPLVFEKIDASKCTSTNPSGCVALVRALAYNADPACLRNAACTQYVTNAGKTSECWRNEQCTRAVAAMVAYKNVGQQCIQDPTNCRLEWQAIMKYVNMVGN